jgi:general secretion pathway protein K
MTNALPNPLRQRGVALAIVVWFIAGMSLLVMGIVSHARVDTRMAQLHSAKARAAAAGDGAIQLMMADATAGNIAPAGTEPVARGRYRLGELEVTVTLTPAAGLIDLNTAPNEILAALFRVAGGLGEVDAQTAADNVVKWRSAAGRRDATSRFASIEDLVRVEGIGRTLMDSVADYVAAGASTQRGTEWALSPESVLEVMAAVDPARARSIVQRRAASSGERSGRAGDGADPTLAGAVRADALVNYGDERWLRRRWIVAVVESGSLLPWRTARIEPPRMDKE